MKQLSTLTQSLANVYPEWSKVRLDEQSLGQRFLNCCACQLELMAKEIIRGGHNFHLTTANLNEVDWIYRVDLGSDFSFDEDNTDPFNPLEISPTVSGIVDSISYEISVAERNDIETFWYKHIPDRISEGATASGVFILLYDETANAPFESVYDPHLPGKLYIELIGDERLLYVDDDDKLRRAIITITGKTRKGTTESESLAFPWAQKQRTFKEWAEIDKIECSEVPSGMMLSVCSADFINGPYIDFWNLAYSPYRKKIDQFWDLDDTGYGSTLDLIKYTTDDIQHMLDGLYSTYSGRRFELLDESDNNITAIDMAQQPFSDYIWVVTSGELLCYSSILTTVDDGAIYREMTVDNNIALEFSEDHTVRGETVDVDFVCAIPTLPVNKFRSWVEYPNGTYSGILHGELMTYSETDYCFVDYHEYNIDNRYTFIPDQLGEYVFGMEAEMKDGTDQITKRVLFVDYKEPLAQFSLPSGIVDSGVLGIEFSTDQDLWVATQSGFHQIDLHHDVMLVDYENKLLFLREDYDEVEIW